MKLGDTDGYHWRQSWLGSVHLSIEIPLKVIPPVYVLIFQMIVFQIAFSLKFGSILCMSILSTCPDHCGHFYFIFVWLYIQKFLLYCPKLSGCISLLWSRCFLHHFVFTLVLFGFFFPWFKRLSFTLNQNSKIFGPYIMIFSIVSQWLLW